MGELGRTYIDFSYMILPFFFFYVEIYFVFVFLGVIEGSEVTSDGIDVKKGK